MKKQVNIKKSGKRTHEIQHVVSKLVRNGKVNEKGGLTYFANDVGFDSTKTVVLLNQMITMGNAELMFDKGKIITKAILECIKNDREDADFFLSAMESILGEMQNTRESSFYVLTEISFDVNICMRREWVFDGCKLTLSESFDDMFNSRKIFLREKHCYGESRKYTHVTVKVKSKTPKGALAKGIRALNIFRSLCCFDTYNVDSVIAGHLAHVNNLRIGRYQTVHDSKGEVFRNCFRHNEKFSQERNLVLFEKGEAGVIERNVAHHLSSISNCKYSNIIESALVRYVSAIDECDSDISIVKLWGALEQILAHGESNCDKVPDRAAAVFHNDVSIKEWVFNIRDYRNKYIHEGESGDLSSNLKCRLSYIFKWVIVSFLRKKKNSVNDVLVILDFASKGNEYLMLKEDEIREARELIGTGS